MVYLDTCLDEKKGMVVLHIGEIYDPAILFLDIHPKDCYPTKGTLVYTPLLLFYLQ